MQSSGPSCEQADGFQMLTPDKGCGTSRSSLLNRPTCDELGMWPFLQKRSQSSSSRTRGRALLFASRKSAAFVQEPQQLNDSFTDLEELNLFLIQSSQASVARRRLQRKTQGRGP